MEYRYIKEFTIEQLEELFLSVDWFSGKYPEKLQIAMRNSPTVISAWDGEQLAGLIRGFDDGAWQATIDCLLVNPRYQGQGVASTLLRLIMEKYKDLLYVEVVPDEKRNVGFYEKHGFKIMEDGTPMITVNPGWKR